MPPKKAVKSVVKPAAKQPQPLKAAVPQPKISREDLVKQAIALQQKHQKGVQVNPTAPAKPQGKVTVVEMTFTLSTGDVLMAEGEHADVLYRYNEECQRQCIDHGLATYDGPDLHRFTAEQWAQRKSQA